MANRNAGEHALGQVNRQVIHPPAEARRAEATLLAAERHQVLEGAARTLASGEPVLEPPAPQKRLELPLDKGREASRRSGKLTEQRQMLRDRLVQDALFGAPRAVARKWGTSRHRRRAGIPALLSGYRLVGSSVAPAEDHR